MSIKKEGYRMSINDLVLKVNDVLTGSVLIIALVGIGLLFTFKLGFIQIRGFKDGWNRTFGGLFSKKGDAGKDGMSSFQALATAIAAQVGTGNIAGAATAIAVGGPGAIFWMWIAAFLGMATIYAEAIMAQKYKTVGADGQVTGGPVYYIRAAFKGTFGKVLAGIFAILITLALGFISNILSFATSTLYLPIVFLVAIICLFRFVKQILSSSTNIKFCTPALTNPSTTNEPTPPNPKIATFALFNFSIPSFPISNSVLEN